MKKAVIIARAPGMGKSRLLVRCSCLAQNMFYVWSWAGNGWARCWHCKAKIYYRTLEVKHDQP